MENTLPINQKRNNTLTLFRQYCFTALLFVIFFAKGFGQAPVPLSTSPTLTFTTNSEDITGDNIASDGEGGSQAISDIDIQIFNISDEMGLF